MRPLGRAVPLYSVSLFAAVAAGATALAFASDDGSGIKGRVVPCGIVLERPASCAVRSAPAGTIVIGRRQHIVRRAKLRADGSFRVRLNAGRYWIQARTGRTRGPRTSATVSEGWWTTVTLIAGRVAPPRAP
jgi:hypothetical protein